MIVTEREAETQAEGEAGSMQEANVGLDSGTPGSRPGPKAGAKPLSHPGIPSIPILKQNKMRLRKSGPKSPTARMWNLMTKSNCIRLSALQAISWKAL